MSSTPATSPSPISPRSRPSKTAANALLERCQADPVWFATEILGVHLWSRQREIIQAVRDHPRVAVRSGHGVGKTKTAAVAALWFLFSFPNSRVVTTATKWAQVEKQLWHEINQLHRRARAPLGGTCLNTRVELEDGRYAIGLSAKPENSESFAGHHAPHILVIYDEASGIHSKIFEVGEGYMTTDGARALLIGNPTRPEGEFYSAFHARRSDYYTMHISAWESPPITGETVPPDLAAALTGRSWCEGRREAWGEDSVLYQVRVLGNFAKQASDAVISLGVVEDAQDRELRADNKRDLIVIGCDVARYGTDETVITERVGQRVRIVETYVGKPTTHTAARVAHWATQHPKAATRIVVDDVGVGGGVTDQLRADGWNVTGFNAGEKADQTLQFPNRRSELWFQAAAQLEDLDLDPDDQLAADLTAPRYGYDLKMRRVVESKDETKKRLGRSPDRADAVLLTLVSERSPGAVVMPDRQRRPGRVQPRDETLSVEDLMNQPM